MRKVELDRAGAGALADNDVELIILHGRIQHLLYDPVQTMDLVDEQNIPVLEIREDGGQITGAFENRAGRGLDFHTKLVSDDVRKRGLTETRRSAEQHVIERFSPAASGPIAVRNSPADRWTTVRSSSEE